MSRTASILLASIVTIAAQAADVRDGLVGYWPPDTVALVQNNTPDLVAGHNLQLNGISDDTVLTTGKFGKAFAFDGSIGQTATFTADPTADIGLPGTRNAAYSVLLWERAPATGQSDLRYFSESDVAEAQ